MRTAYPFVNRPSGGGGGHHVCQVDVSVFTASVCGCEAHNFVGKEFITGHDTGESL